MTNVQEALKAAEKLIVKAIMFESEAEQYLSESNYELNGCLGDSAADISVNGKAVLAKVRAALSDIEKCEPVAEVTAQWVIDFIGSNYNSMRTHDEQGNELPHEQITYSLTVHDLLSAFTYTSPISKEWVSLTDEEIFALCPYIDHDLLEEAFYRGARAIESKLKQLNTNV